MTRSQGPHQTLQPEAFGEAAHWRTSGRGGLDRSLRWAHPSAPSRTKPRSVRPRTPDRSTFCFMFPPTPRTRWHVNPIAGAEQIRSAPARTACQVLRPANTKPLVNQHKATLVVSARHAASPLTRKRPASRTAVSARVRAGRCRVGGAVFGERWAGARTACRVPELGYGL